MRKMDGMKRPRARLSVVDRRIIGVAGFTSWIVNHKEKIVNFVIRQLSNINTTNVVPKPNKTKYPTVVGQSIFSMV